jgi:hypothetical protein
VADTSSRSSNRQFNLFSLVWRFAGALLLVLATYNPSGISYFHWLRNATTDGGLGPEHFLVGVALTAGWVVLFVATQRSLGTVGVILTAAILGGIVWLLTDFGIIAVHSVSAVTWASLVCLAALLAVGLSWSHIWRRVTGQYEVDVD